MPTNEKNPSPPRDLSASSAAWWRNVVATYELEPHHVTLVTAAARALDRAESARQAIARNGATYRDKHGVRRPAPEVVIERNSVVLFARLLRELRLDDGGDDESRLPRIPGR